MANVRGMQVILWTFAFMHACRLRKLSVNAYIPAITSIPIILISV